MARLPTYADFPAIAERIRWDPEEIDLSRDAATWPRLEPAEREELAALLAGFLIGETAVAADIGPFGLQASSDEIAASFAVQADDEQRHQWFFERVHAEILGEPPDRAIASARRRVPALFVELFEHDLRAAAARVAADAGALLDAVGLYHGLLEGVIFMAGQEELLQRLEGRDDLPGIAEGIARVQRDERWHVAFGARMLADARGAVSAGRLQDEGRRAIGAWGPLVGPHTAQRTLQVLDRRLRTIGVLVA